LDDVAREAETIDALALSHRFRTNGMPREVRPICMRLNESLERIEAAFLREQRFTADAAHELRTPIAELRSLAEVGLHSCADQDGGVVFAQYLRDALAIAAQMERLVNALLLVARSESGLIETNPQHVDLVKMIHETWQPHDSEAVRRGLSVSFRLPATAFVATDPSLIGAILGNLFSNAVAYAPAGGEIGVELSDDGDAFQLCIENGDASLSQGDLQRIFDPFWRKDPSRSDASHSGLGLTVVAAYARLLRIAVSAELPTHGRFRVTIGPLGKWVNHATANETDPAAAIEATSRSLLRPAGENPAS
jgi:two-component system sensor histidine kinase QseC